MAQSRDVLVDLEDVTLAGPDGPILDRVRLTISAGERVGVVGINGAGKSALLALVAGELAPSAGSVRQRRHLRLAHLPQDPAVTPHSTVADAVGADVAAVALADRLGLAGVRSRRVASLSGGLAKRVALVRPLASEVDLLILDEPTNHLDLETVTWLESHLRATRAAVVLVSHDRTLLDAVTTRLVEVDRGALHEHRGGYAAYVTDLAERARSVVEAEQARRNAARHELAWLRRGAPARSRKPRARIAAATQLLAAGPPDPARAGALDLHGGPTPRLGRRVLSAAGASVEIAGRRVLSEITLEIGPGDHLGIVGANGAGKTTLLELLAGEREPTAGVLRRGATTRPVLFHQHSTELAGSRTVEEVVAGASGLPGSPADRDLLQRFWFTGALARSPVARLSGGERRRLQLLVALARRPNVLLLDEPTNDLDLETIRALEDYLDTWVGTLVVASHDRSFLRRTAERVYTIESAGTLREVPGDITAWVPAAPPSAPSGPSRGRALRDAERRMTSLERRTQRLGAQLAATLDPAEHARLGHELAAALAELAEAEDTWLSLAD